MSIIVMDEQATAPSTLPPSGKKAVTVTPAGGIRVTDTNGVSSVYTPSYYGGNFNCDHYTATVSTTNDTGYDTYRTMSYTIDDTTSSSLYEVKAYFMWGHASTATDFKAQLHVDGTGIGVGMQSEPQDVGADQRFPAVLAWLVSGDTLSTSGNVSLRFGTSSSSNTSYIYSSYMTFKRVK